MRAVTSSVGRAARMVRGSSQRTAVSVERERGEIVDEARFVFEATQVEDDRLILDAADHRYRKPPQRGRQRSQAAAAGASVDRADREPRACHRLEG